MVLGYGIIELQQRGKNRKIERKREKKMNKYIIKCKNLETGKIEKLSSYEMKDYKYAVNCLQTELINKRIEFALISKNSVLIDEDDEEIEVDENTDFIELNINNYDVKTINEKDYTKTIIGFIEVYDVKTKESTFGKQSIKTYDFKF